MEVLEYTVLEGEWARNPAALVQRVQLRRQVLIALLGEGHTVALVAEAACIEGSRQVGVCTAVESAARAVCIQEQVQPAEPVGRLKGRAV